MGMSPPELLTVYIPAREEQDSLRRSVDDTERQKATRIAEEEVQREERDGENSCTERQIRRQTRLRYSRLRPRARHSLYCLRLTLVLLFLSPFYTPRRVRVLLPFLCWCTLDFVSMLSVNLGEGGHEKLSNPPRYRLGTPFVPFAHVAISDFQLLAKH